MLKGTDPLIVYSVCVEVHKIVAVLFILCFVFKSQVSLESIDTPKYWAELVVGTRTSIMFMCTCSVLRKYVNCTSFDFVGGTPVGTLIIYCVSKILNVNYGQLN